VRVLPLGTIYEDQTQEVELAGMSASGRPIRDTIQKDFYLAPDLRAIQFLKCNHADHSRRLIQTGTLTFAPKFTEKQSESCDLVVQQHARSRMLKLV
jgi:hypothetical protein